MAVLKCKMCGGDLNIENNSSVAECEYCGTKQTVPNVDDEKKLSLFARANKLRFACEFDKASGVYESIVADFPEEAEAYWGLILCTYGIEYVDDPVSGKKIPTCHRSSFDSVMDDSNFEMVMENADAVACGIYREEAKKIEELRQGIIEVSSREEPYDIFICYKETDINGDRTVDSVIAQDVYEALTERGYRVFFSRITLEDKLGVEYEPYIFAALNSAKIMLAFGTDYQHYNAVWVKNEWSRFLSLISKGEKKTLIPCYKGIDAYDMPKEFTRLQAQDMGKVGAIQDLLRGIEKILPLSENSAPVHNTVSAVYGGFDIEDALRKVQIHLSNKKWKSVQDGCNRILDIDPECAMAYVYQLARLMRATDINDLVNSVEILSTKKAYNNALKYADPRLKEQLEAWCRSSVINYENAKKRCLLARERIDKLKGLVSGGKEHSAGVLTNGTVMACGSNEKGQCNVKYWRNITAVCCGAYYTVGLRADGTVVACGDNTDGQCNVGDWCDIVAVSCDENHTVGLKSDGTVVACGSNANGKCDITGWKDIVDISCGYHHTVGLKSDGTFVFTGSNRFGQDKVNNWSDIAAFTASNVQTIALKNNGTVVACGDDSEKRINIKAWRDIVDLSMGTHHTVGLCGDGTIITCGSDGCQRCSGTTDWTDIVSVVCGPWHTLGIRSDGTVLACGEDDTGKCNTTSWKLFNNVDTIEIERIEVGRKPALMAKLSKISAKLFEGAPHLFADENGKAILTSKDEELFGCKKWSNIVKVTEEVYTVSGLCKDGTVLSCGAKSDGICNTEYWTDIIDVTRKGGSYVVGLKADGTVVASGYNRFGQCNVENWSNIAKIKCFDNKTYGIKHDGTVVSCGDNEFGACNVQGWSNIVDIVGNGLGAIGLCGDGTVLSCGNSPLCQFVRNWKNIKQISCGLDMAAGLCEDGSVVLATENGAIALDGWENIVSVAAGNGFVLGLCDNGTVLSYGKNDYGATNVSSLSDIVAIAANGYSSFALGYDGTVYLSAKSGWERHHIYNNVSRLADGIEVDTITDSERESIIQRMNQKRLSRQKAGVCVHCGGELKGLLSKKCADCGVVKDY